jgi:LCP family protein required for cell wall assembly
VLLLGLDYRDWEAQEEASRSDTMILLTLDPQSKTAGILSIPRDLWVSIPGFQHGKINTAYYLGDAYQLPGGGPALAVKTVEDFIGVPINYYAQVDFAAFVRFIDEIGGVKVDVPAPITIDLLGTGAKTKKKLKPGVQVLPGEWALAYARNRYTEGGDFDRAARQQQVIMGIREQILRVDMLPNLISKAPALYNELASSIRTNLALDEVISLALLAQSVPDEGIKRGIINTDNVFFGNSPDGLSILIPIPDDIQNLRDEIFATAGAIGPQVPGSPQEQMRTEAARLAVYDGSSDSSLGGRAVEYLRSQGANVTQTGAADRAYSGTRIVDHTGNPYLVSYLVELLQIAPANINVEFDPNAAADVELYLGADLARLNIVP